MVVARVLTTYDMGVYAIAVVSVGLMFVVQAIGLRSLINREEVLTKALSSSVHDQRVAFLPSERIDRGAQLLGRRRAI